MVRLSMIDQFMSWLSLSLKLVLKKSCNIAFKLSSTTLCLDLVKAADTAL